MAASSSNLVLATAWNLRTSAVHVFVESLRRHYRGDAMMLVSSKNSAELVAYLRSKKITPVYFDCPSWMVMHIQVGRYVRYGEILRGLSREYQRVLLTDASDVVFQGDPFAKLPDGELLCFLEAKGRTIGECGANQLWLEQIYGAETVQKLKGFEISCSGTTIGSQGAIVEYIDLMLEAASPKVMFPLTKYRGHDQGIHNYLLRTGALPKARIIENGDHVLTVGCMGDAQIKLGANGTILALGSGNCPIVHQYNRRPAALAHVKAAYGERADAAKEPKAQGRLRSWLLSRVGSV